MAVVITDGYSFDNVKDPAQELRDAGVNIYAIGSLFQHCRDTDRARDTDRRGRETERENE